MTHDPYTLPTDLPVPADDGACDGLLGRALPEIKLRSTVGDAVRLSELESTVVFYVYPRTGRPGVDPVPAWDDVPGARGCTPQSCAFRDHHAELQSLGADVFGVSAQTRAEQREFADRAHLPYPLLSDDGFILSRELGLPTFVLAGQRFYRRVTFIARNATIVKVFYPVFPPDRSAAEVVMWLEHDGGRADATPSEIDSVEQNRSGT
jgi:peroxiredoxin